MPIDPFEHDRDHTRQQTGTEYGWGRGMHADPAVHVGPKDRPLDLPYEPPMQDDQLRVMREYRRMNTAGGDGLETAEKLDEPSDLTYVAGNPDRYGAQPPLVRDRGAPCLPEREPYRANKFRRAE